MTNHQSELESEQPRKEIVIGEWFNHFTNYDDVPYRHNYKRENYSDKIFPFTIRSVGKFTIVPSWEPVRETWLKKGKVIIVSHLGEQIIDVENFSNTQEFENKFETKLLIIDIACVEEKYTGRNLPYLAQMRLPSGKVIQTVFRTDSDIDQPLAYYWQDGNTGEEIWPLIPEVENILEKIQMRIVPANQT